MLRVTPQAKETLRRYAVMRTTELGRSVSINKAAEELFLNAMPKASKKRRSASAEASS